MSVFNIQNGVAGKTLLSCIASNKIHEICCILEIYGLNNWNSCWN